MNFTIDDQFASEVHQAAAFSVYRSAVTNGGAQRREHRTVAGQAGCVDLRETAAEVESIYFREAAVVQGRGEDQFRAGRFKSLEVLGVVEAEGLVPEYANPDRFSGRDR